MKKHSFWDHLNKKTLPKFWNKLTPELRRKYIVGKGADHLSWCSLKRWQDLTPDEQRSIHQLIKNYADRAYIIKMMKRFINELKQI